LLAVRRKECSGKPTTVNLKNYSILMGRRKKGNPPEWSKGRKKDFVFFAFLETFILHPKEEIVNFVLGKKCFRGRRISRNVHNGLVEDFLIGGSVGNMRGEELILSGSGGKNLLVIGDGGDCFRTGCI